MDSNLFFHQVPIISWNVLIALYLEIQLIFWNDKIYVYCYGFSSVIHGPFRNLFLGIFELRRGIMDFEIEKYTLIINLFHLLCGVRFEILFVAIFWKRYRKEIILILKWSNSFLPLTLFMCSLRSASKRFPLGYQWDGKGSLYVSEVGL